LLDKKGDRRICEAAKQTQKREVFPTFMIAVFCLIEDFLASSFSCSQAESTPPSAMLRERKPLKLSKKSLSKTDF
jgi:hypothetical protein